MKLHLDLAVGETGDIDRSDKEKSESLAQRVQDLNARLQDIRREQVFQRVTAVPWPLTKLFLPSHLNGKDVFGGGFLWRLTIM